MTNQSIKTFRLYVYRVKSKSKKELKRNGKIIPINYVSEKFVKIGMTSQNKISDRFTKFPDAFVEWYEFSLMTSQQFETRRRLFDVEQELHKNLESLRYTPRNRFSGWTECYKGDAATMKIIKAAIWEMREKYSPNCKALKQKTASARLKDKQAPARAAAKERRRLKREAKASRL